MVCCLEGVRRIIGTLVKYSASHNRTKALTLSLYPDLNNSNPPTKPIKQKHTVIVSSVSYNQSYSATMSAL